jgi:5-methylcytosine-specific restriction endonuclease McrA
MTNGAVLVLNSVYQAIQVTGVRRAFRLFYADRARAVAEDFRTYSFPHWCDRYRNSRPDSDFIHTPTRRILVPRVIQLVRYDRVPRREIRFTRRNVFHRDRSRCQYCGRVFHQRQLNIDHVVPLSRGGKSSWDNVVCACIECNSRKGDRTPEEARITLIRVPRKPSPQPILKDGWARRGYKEWNPFLEGTHWHIELCDDAIPAPEED